MSGLRRVLGFIVSAALFVCAFVGVTYRVFTLGIGLWATLIQYGVASGLYAGAFYLVEAVCLLIGGDSSRLAGWRLSVIGCTALSLVVGLALVIPNADATGIVLASYVLLDVVCPLGALVDWVVSEKGALSYSQLLWVAAPLVAYALMLVAVAPSLGWPHYFLDASARGWLAVAFTMLAFGLVALGVSALVVLADQRLGRYGGDKASWT